MSNLPPKKVSYKPPPTPRRGPIFSKAPAFQQLSPIIGSSPEPGPGEQINSQSSRIPRSRSTPPSQQQSPVRKLPPTQNQHTPRSQSRNASRNTSRDSSPAKPLASPTKAAKRFRDVQAKVNSFNKLKPKVPPKPQVSTNSNETAQNGTSNRTENKTNQKPQLTRKDSVNKITNASSRSSVSKNNSNSTSNNNINTIAGSNNSLNNANKNAASKNTNNLSNQSLNNNSVASDDKGSNKALTNIVAKNDASKEAEANNNSNSKTNVTGSTTSLRNDAQNNRDTPVNSGATNSQIKKTESKTSIRDSPQLPSSIIRTTKPNEPIGNEEAMDDFLRGSNDDIKPMVDGRVLSATSVSNAINKMNDTVLNSNTLMRDHNFTKISPAASAIISMSAAANQTKTYDSKNLTSSSENEKKAVDKINEEGRPVNGDRSSINSVINNNNTHTDFIKLGNTVGNLNRFSTDHKITGLSGTGNSFQKNSNDRLLDARTVVAADVKPLRITVKEKPQNVEVQSGNVRILPSNVNGVNEIGPR